MSSSVCYSSISLLTMDCVATGAQDVFKSLLLMSCWGWPSVFTSPTEAVPGWSSWLPSYSQASVGGNNVCRFWEPNWCPWVCPLQPLILVPVTPQRGHTATPWQNGLLFHRWDFSARLNSASEDRIMLSVLPYLSSVWCNSSHTSAIYFVHFVISGFY